MNIYKQIINICFRIDYKQLILRKKKWEKLDLSITIVINLCGIIILVFIGIDMFTGIVILENFVKQTIIFLQTLKN